MKDKCADRVEELTEALIRIRKIAAGNKAVCQVVDAALREKGGEEMDEKLAGVLTSAYGQRGFKKALPGHPVYETKDRYVIYLEPEASTQKRERVPFYKETLEPFIKK